MMDRLCKNNFFLISLACLSTVITFVRPNDLPVHAGPDKTWNILIKGAKPLMPDAYLCSHYPVQEEETFIYKFEALANASTAHHMLLYGCDGISYGQRSQGRTDFWRCPPVCLGQQTILFAWAKNAPPTVLPNDVGYRIGKQTSIKTIVIQVHYAKAFKVYEKADYSGLKLYLTHKQPRYVAGVHLMLASNFMVPPHQSSYGIDMSCQFNERKSIFPFAYRTHAHGLGKVITGYQINGSYTDHKDYHEIGRGNPQWPQAFYPVKQNIEVKPGDYLAARCTYDSTKKTNVVRVGIEKAFGERPPSTKETIEESNSPIIWVEGNLFHETKFLARMGLVIATGNDEMCNFYTMFYTDSSVRDLAFECYNNEYPDMTGDNFPANVSDPLPYNATLEEEAKGHHHHHHGGMPNSHVSIESTIPADVDEGGNLHDDLNQKHSLKTVLSRPMDVGLRAEDPDVSVPQRPSNTNWASYGKSREIGDMLNDEGQPERYRYGSLDGINQRDLSLEKRVNSEYYDDYAANDFRDQGHYNPSEIELSRNRNKEFDAMNQQLQHFPRRNNSSWRNSPQQQPPQLQQPLRRPRPPGPNKPLLQPGQAPGRGMQSSGDKSSKSLGGDKAKGHLSRIHIEEKLVFNSSWPDQSLSIGQVGGLSTDKNGNLHIFHRATRIWSTDSFDYNNNFVYQDAPIMDDVVVILDPNGKLVRKFGSGMFFMPHGIHVDQHNNIWLTDVALHQVFKIPFNESKPSLTLGKRFRHSTDLSYFCKPTDVTVLSTGEFYVTDGYCNGRVLKFSPEGHLIKSWGQRNSFQERHPKPGDFNVPHSITVSEADKQVCVADRENGRIQCFDLDGNFKSIIKHREFGIRLFAVEYCSEHGGLLYAVNGPEYDGAVTNPVQGFTMSMKTGDLIETWNVPQSLKNPHDVCVDPKTHSVYVGELSPRAVWKFTRMNEKDAQKTKSEYKELDHHEHHDKDHDHDIVNNVKKGGTAAPLPITTTTLETRAPKTPNNETSENNDASVDKKKVLEKDPQRVTVSIVVGCLLVIPVVLVLIIALVFRGHQSGKFNCCGNKNKNRHKRVFNFQRLLGNSHKGFDPLSTEESDHDLDPDDSDHDEYTAPRKNKA